MGLLDRLRRRRAVDEPGLVDDGSLVVVVASDDPAAADSAVLAAAAAHGLDLDRPYLVRHRLVLPGEDAVVRCASVVRDEGYRVEASDRRGGSDLVAVQVSRVERLTGQGLAQERSRMAGLASRLGGDVRGWEALGPPAGQHGPTTASGRDLRGRR